MNHLYRIVWNAHAACWQAVSETAKGRLGKAKSKIKKNEQILGCSKCSSIVAILLCLSTQMVSASSFTSISPSGLDVTSLGASTVGGVVIDLRGTNNSHVLSQLASSTLFIGFSNYGSPSNYIGNPLTIGIQSGFTRSVRDALGGGLASMSIRFTLSDGDSASGDFDFNDLTLMVNNIDVGNWSNVDAEGTDSLGTTVLPLSGGGFRDGVLDTGWFHISDSATLNGIFNSLSISEQLALQVFDLDPGDNYYDFTGGIDSSLLNVGQGPIATSSKNIDLSSNFHSSGSLGISVNANFEGGTLRLSESNVYPQNFTINNSSGTIDSNGLAATFSGVFSDLTPGVSGALTVSDSSKGGAVTFTGMNTYTGATNIAGGTLALANLGSIAASSGVNLSAVGAMFDVSGVSSGASTIQDLSGVAGSTVNTGATILTVGTANSTSFGGVFSGTGGINKVNSGELELKGNSSNYSGANTVSGGTLRVNGSLGGGSLDVLSGARLAGSGTVGGSTTIHAGGTISPGNSIGTLTVNGSLTQAPGSLYLVELNTESGRSDLIQVNGRAQVEGAMLAVSSETDASLNLDSSFEILRASGGVSGNYTLLNAPRISAFYDLGSVVNGNSAYLQAVQTTPFEAAGNTFNQKQAAKGIQNLPSGNPLRRVIGGQQSLDAAKYSFDRLSGELFPTVAGQQMLKLRDLHTTAFSVQGELECISPSVVNISNTKESDNTPCPAENLDVRSWAALTNGDGDVDSDGNAHSANFSASGLMAGFEKAIKDGHRLGIMVSADSDQLAVTELSSSAKGNTLGVAVYGSGAIGELTYRVLGGFAQHEMRATRYIEIPGLQEQTKAEYGAHSVYTYSEVAKSFSFGAASLEPFAGLSLVHHVQHGFSESSNGNPGVAVLTVKNRGQSQTLASVGVKGKSSFTLGGLKVDGHMGLAVETALSGRTTLTSARFGSESGFVVAGVPTAKTTVLVELGANIQVKSNVTLGVDFAGQFAGNRQNQGGRVSLKYKF